jgi:hypothetical protein
MKWIEALKVFNNNKSVWSIPRKGTKDYDEVRAIMADGAAPKAAKAAPKKAKAPKRPAPGVFFLEEEDEEY